MRHRSHRALSFNRDLQLKRLFETAMKRLARATTSHQRYAIAASIMNHRPPLYFLGGYKSESAFIARVLKESRPTAYRKLKVSTLASAKQVARFGLTRLELAIRYIELERHRTLERPADINFERLRIAGQPLIEVSPRELRSAISRLRDERSTRDLKTLERLVTAARGFTGATATVSETELLLRLPVRGISVIADAFTR